MTAGRRLALAGAVLAAPFAWAAQLVIGYGLEAGGCSVGGPQLAGADVTDVAGVVSLVALAVAVAGGVTALLLLRRRDPDADPRGVAIATACTANIPIESYRQAVGMILGFDRRADLARISVPTLAMAGEVDTVAPAPMMQKMAALIPGARFLTVAGAGHLINLEQPAAFNAALLEWLAPIEGASGALVPGTGVEPARPCGH